ncbi:MAG: hypothetical protein IT462_16085 [Planctomycetes bacterium]|nr:hypothetical protein [Planctomycetota bacterium]
MVDHAPQPHLSSEKLADLRRQLADHKAKQWTTSDYVFWTVTLIFAVSVVTCAVWPMPASPRESKSSEARAALGTIKDRLRVKFIQNKGKADPSWKLSDLVNTSELAGQYYGAADYSLVSLTENTAMFRAAANTNNTSPQVTMTVTNIQTGAATLTSP